MKRSSWALVAVLALIIGTSGFATASPAREAVDAARAERSNFEKANNALGSVLAGVRNAVQNFKGVASTMSIEEAVDVNHEKEVEAAMLKLQELDDKASALEEAAVDGDEDKVFAAETARGEFELAKEDEAVTSEILELKREVATREHVRSFQDSVLRIATSLGTTRSTIANLIISGGDDFKREKYGEVRSVLDSFAMDVDSLRTEAVSSTPVESVDSIATMLTMCIEHAQSAASIISDFYGVTPKDLSTLEGMSTKVDEYVYQAGMDAEHRQLEREAGIEEAEAAATEELEAAATEEPEDEEFE